MNRLRTRTRVRKQRVAIGASDPVLTPNAGLVAVTELVEGLGVTAALGAGIGSVKQRDRGMTGGELLVSLVSCHLTGGDHLVSLDRLRADTTGQELVSVPAPASTTGIAVLNQRVLARVGQVRRSALLKTVTLDLDATDVDVYGRSKKGLRLQLPGPTLLSTGYRVLGRVGRSCRGGLVVR